MVLELRGKLRPSLVMDINELDSLLRFNNHYFLMTLNETD